MKSSLKFLRKTPWARDQVENLGKGGQIYLGSRMLRSHAYPWQRSKGRTLGMSGDQPNNPLHGLTLEKIVVNLVDHYGWEELANKIDINCFKNDPSVKSSLKFLRKTPWARQQVESLYIATFT